MKYYNWDTRFLSDRTLKAIKKHRDNKSLVKVLSSNKEFKNIYVTVCSFGFKYGIPSDADLVFDVRFLPNPYYIEQLRYQTGNDTEIRQFVMENDSAKEFLEKLRISLKKP